jgi:hypothetical protein
MKYAKKAQLVDAVQFDGFVGSVECAEKLFGESITTVRLVRAGNKVEQWRVYTALGTVNVDLSDYVVRDADNECCVMRPDEFETIYFPVMDLNAIGAAVFEIGNDGALDEQLSQVVAKGINELLKSLGK